VDGSDVLARFEAAVRHRAPAKTASRVRDRFDHRVPRGEEVQRFARHLRRERSALFTFLYYDAVPPTSFLAEQALRPAVVNGKMSAGNNTPRGAKTQAMLMTVLHSARKRSVDTISLVVRALRNPALFGNSCDPVNSYETTASRIPLCRWAIRLVRMRLPRQESLWRS